LTARSTRQRGFSGSVLNGISRSSSAAVTCASVICSAGRAATMRRTTTGLVCSQDAISSEVIGRSGLSAM
jgi:hypothetical protein